MSSSITNYSNKIDINYPEVGKDNDTQGFRDNFRNIQSALLVASDEISNLQDSGVKLDQDNDFNFNTIQNAVLKNTSQAAASPKNITTATSYNTVDYANGVYHVFTVTNTGTSTYHSFNIINWPGSGNYGTVHIQVTPQNTSTSTLNVTSTGTVTLLGTNSFPRTYNQTKPVIYEAWTTNNGASVYVIELTSV